MAKVPFTKLKLKINDNVQSFTYADGVEIEVKQYLPIQEKLNIVTEIILQAHEAEANYSNPMKVSAIRDLMILFNYTNITFTDKQKEDLSKLYDIVKSNGLIEKIKKCIPEEEYAEINEGLFTTIKAVYDYQNSVLGVLDTIKSDYADTEYDVEELASILNTADFSAIQEIMSKLN